MTQTELGGVVVPVITPVDADDRVDEPAYRQVIRRLIEAGVNGLFIGGSAGEGPLLTEREWQRMLEIAFDEARGALPLLGGAMDTSLQRIKARIRVLAGIGYEFFVVTPTYYGSLHTADEHRRLFSACAEAGQGMSLIIYNIPAVSHSVVPVEVVLDLARRGLVRYCKESSADPFYFKRLLREGAALGLKVFVGDEASIAQALEAGACGIVPVCANYEPQTYIDAYQAAQRQDWAGVARCQERVMVLRDKLPLAAPNWVAGIKYAVSLLGIGSGQTVSPMEPLDAAQRASVEAFVRG